MSKFVIFLLVYACLSLSSVKMFAQECDVKIEAIQGTYEGDCKKGLAHGEGKAVGTDTYEGEFKKGLPHGKGLYYFANGDTFDGNFEKGLMEGKGVLILAGGIRQEGYWSEGEYIGKEKDPYTIIQKSNSILRVTFKRQSGDGDQIRFTFSRLGKPIQISSLNIQSEFGVEVTQSNFDRVFDVHIYPCNPVINFAVQANRDATGSQLGSNVDGNLSFEIRQGGTWEVQIEMQGQE